MLIDSSLITRLNLACFAYLFWRKEFVVCVQIHEFRFVSARMWVLAPAEFKLVYETVHSWLMPCCFLEVGLKHTAWLRRLLTGEGSRSRWGHHWRPGTVWRTGQCFFLFHLVLLTWQPWLPSSAFSWLEGSSQTQLRELFALFSILHHQHSP